MPVRRYAAHYCFKELDFKIVLRKENGKGEEEKRQEKRDLNSLKNAILFIEIVSKTIYNFIKVSQKRYIILFYSFKKVKEKGEAISLSSYLTFHSIISS